MYDLMKYWQALNKIDDSKKCVQCTRECVGRCPTCFKFLCQVRECSEPHVFKCKEVVVKLD